MIEKSKILKYLTQEIENLDMNYNNFSWTESMMHTFMEKIITLEDIKILIENGHFDFQQNIERNLKNELSSTTP